MTSILSAGTSKKRRMSRFELSDTVRTRVGAPRRQSHIDVARVGVAPARFGRYCGNIRWMQSWIVTTDRHVHERRQHVVRRVEEVDALAPQRQRDR